MESFGKNEVKCEQVEAMVLDLQRDDGEGSLERAAVAAHLSHCSRCAALQESWQTAREELQALGEATMEGHALARVEMRLRQEFRTRHRTMLVRRRAMIVSWALGAAAILVGGVSWWNWRQAQHPEFARQNKISPNGRDADNTGAGQGHTPNNLSSRLLSGEDTRDFTPLPGSVLDETEEAAILRVRMQRGSLGALGMPVNEQRVGEWIQVDLLVGNDGLPQAVRLAQEEN